MRIKNIIYVFLFSLLIPLNYLTFISSQLPDFQEALELRTTSGIPIYLTTFQLWTFDIISSLFDSIVVAISVGIVSYFIKDIKFYVALLFGLFSKYIILIGILLYSYIYSGEKITLPFFTNLAISLDLRQSILISFQIPLTLYFSYLGYNYGKRIDYFDPKDKKFYYFYGVPKKIWLLLFISMNPVAKFLSKLTIIQIYEVTIKLISMNFWKDTFSIGNVFSEDSARGISGLLGHFMVIFIVWAIAVALFIVGLNAIRNRDAKFRWLTICSIFVLLPIIVSIIPIIRNRTWLF